MERSVPMEHATHDPSQGPPPHRQAEVAGSHTSDGFRGESPSASGAAAVGKWWLVAIDGPSPIHFELPASPAPAPSSSAEARATIGRSSACRFQMLSRRVSRRHASIERVGQRWVITDLGSRDGTWLNGVPIRPHNPVPLRDGDRIGIGPWLLRLAYSSGDAPPVVDPSISGLSKLLAELRRESPLETLAPPTEGPSSDPASTLVDASLPPPTQPMVMPARAGVESPSLEPTAEGPSKIDTALALGIDRVLDRVIDEIIGTDSARALPESLVRRRLALLMDVAGDLHAADSEAALAEVVCKALSRLGAGLDRVLVLKSGDATGSLRVLARSTPLDVGDVGHLDLRPSVRGSIISRALTGETAIAQANETTSAGRKLAAAVCSPIRVGRAVVMLIYVSSTTGRPQPDADELAEAASLAHAVAQMAGMAMASLTRRDLELRRRLLEAELRSAREAQRLLLPPLHGRFERVEYACHVEPGGTVVGDLLDVVALPDGRVALFLGDVVEKGAGAGILMATAQTHLRAELLHHGRVVDAVGSLNRLVASLSDRAGGGLFLSLFAAVADGRSGVLEYVDAGHSHWIVHRAGEPLHRRQPASHRPGLLVGVDPSFVFQATTLRLGPQDRLVVFSDGLVEQPSAERAGRFGAQRVAEALAHSQDPRQDVERLVHAVRAFAGDIDAPLNDDTTVASFALLGDGAKGLSQGSNLG